MYHILNGDSLAYSFLDANIEEEIIVVREGLIDGDLSGDDLDDFWHTRAKYIGITDAEYQSKVVSEFQKIMNSPDGSEFNLWFEYDLFCQVNMWFTISTIHSLPVKKKVFAVNTTWLERTDKRFWGGYGAATTDELAICFADRILLDNADIQLAHQLWTAYKCGNFTALTHLAENKSQVFPYLKEVVKAHVDRFPKAGTKGRPEKVIEAIIQAGAEDFHQVFKAFRDVESIYGFGDIQLKHLYDKVMHDRD